MTQRKLERRLKTVGISIAVITIPIGGSTELGQVCAIANAATENFYASMPTSEVVLGEWSWRRMPVDDGLPTMKSRRYPAIVFIGTGSQDPNNPKVELLTRLIAHVSSMVDVDLRMAPIWMHYGNRDFTFTEVTEKVEA